MSLLLSGAIDSTCCATRIVSTLVEDAAKQTLPENEGKGLRGFINLALRPADLDALVHAVYEAERYAREARETFEAEKAGKVTP